MNIYTVRLNDKQEFSCDENTTIFDAAKAAGIILEHSCLAARCSSCLAIVTNGSTKSKQDDLVLTPGDKKQGKILTCNCIPTSNIELSAKDIGTKQWFDKKIIPAKINEIKLLKDNIMYLSLRLPPMQQLKFHPGQFVNIIKGDIKRSYSLASAINSENKLDFFIKNYPNGVMSSYLFENAKEADLLRVEGPLGSFFLRDTNKKNIILLATGTGIAPMKAILEDVQIRADEFKNQQFWLFWGAREDNEFFWDPKDLVGINLSYVKVCSRADESYNGARGYIQNVVLDNQIELRDAQVYACGSMDMINSSKETLFRNGLAEEDFFSDAFVVSN